VEVFPTYAFFTTFDGHYVMQAIIAGEVTTALRQARTSGLCGRRSICSSAAAASAASGTSAARPAASAASRASRSAAAMRQYQESAVQPADC
jgi:hypothetical protein